MKLLLSILDDRSAGRVADALVGRRFGVTRINTVGGFLKRGNATLLVGVDESQVDEAIELMRSAYGGTTAKGDGPSGPVFVLGVDQVQRL
ncbi:MAG TPA: cyclic-di-AMP receptor [Chloroflexota bacterium]|nr:cyclic-di-AMP receptor [Chloroflexota bacterium]